MKVSDIVNQLRAILPKYTDYVSDVLAIDSIAVSGGVATIVTTTVHGLTTGNSVTLSDVSVATPLDAVAQDGLTFTFQTTRPHDLTFGWEEHTTVTLDAFTDTAWNDSFTLLAVPNRNIFKVRSVNSLPTLNGNEYLLEKRVDGVNGRFSATVVNTTTFTISGDFIDGDYFGGVVGSSQRVAGAVTIERAIEQYTEQQINDYWIFVVPADAEVSKDRNTFSDATATRTASDDMRLRLVDGFNIYIVKSTTVDIAGVDAVDICRHTLLLPVLKSVNGVRFDTGLSGSADFKTVLLGHSLFAYNRAFIVYEYSFQFTMDLTNNDSVEQEDTRAFRDIDYTHEFGDEDTTNLTVEDINLDEDSTVVLP